jgi:hypothetical protein
MMAFEFNGWMLIAEKRNVRNRATRMEGGGGTPEVVNMGN